MKQTKPINFIFNCLNLKGEMNIRTLWNSISDLIQIELPWITVWIRMKININIQPLYSIKPWFQFKAFNTKSFEPVNKRKKTSITMIATRHFCIGPNRFSLLKLITNERKYPEVWSDIADKYQSPLPVPIPILVSNFNNNVRHWEFVEYIDVFLKHSVVVALI